MCVIQNLPVERACLWDVRRENPDTLNSEDARARRGRWRTAKDDCAKSDARQKQIPRFARDDNTEKLFGGELGIGDSTGFYLADFVEALAEALLEALVGWLVIDATGEIVGEAGHVRDFII